MSIFPRFTVVASILKRVPFTQDSIHSNISRLLESFDKHAFPFVKLATKLGKPFVVVRQLSQLLF